MLKGKLMGRLGNQLFIYAFSRELYHKYHHSILLYNNVNHTKTNEWPSRLSNYPLNKNVKFTTNEKDVLNCSFDTKIAYLYYKLGIHGKDARQIYNYELKNLHFLEKHKLYLITNGYAPLPDNMLDNTYFEGYFQSPKYFEEIRDELLKELIPVHTYSEYEKHMLNEIKKSESVCLTIRLGDYLKYPAFQVCTPEYYYTAMEKMKEMHPNCKFFVFSDDMEAVKREFDFKYPVTYEQGKMEDYVSLNIMSQCDHFIIPNSSFSWWAQYLSQNLNKTVIAPDKWFTIDIPCDIYQDNWLILKGNPNL